MGEDALVGDAALVWGSDESGRSLSLMHAGVHVCVCVCCDGLGRSLVHAGVHVCVYECSDGLGRKGSDVSVYVTTMGWDVA